ncbi:hypothetical protein L7F22_046734 [Adiantum nelumboides]|nr:hypothetical protein [Adiantum nelumboides]MCO5592731.1 hypothetical protein [Adiantum nelumboides]
MNMASKCLRKCLMRPGLLVFLTRHPRLSVIAAHQRKQLSTSCKLHMRLQQLYPPSHNAGAASYRIAVPTSSSCWCCCMSAYNSAASIYNRPAIWRSLPSSCLAVSSPTDAPRSIRSGTATSPASRIAKCVTHSNWSSPSLRNMKKASSSSFHGELDIPNESRRSCRRRKGNRAPKGHVAVYVEEGKERHVVPIGYLSHPQFQELLKRAESEFGFEQKGGLQLPCSRANLLHTLHRIRFDIN